MSDAVIISSRVRLARNLKDYPFPNRMDEKTREEIAEKVKALMCKSEFCGYKFLAVKMEDVGEFDRVSMVERHLISPDFASGDKGKLLITTENEEISIMVGEEDHLRIQVILPGFEPEKAYEIADKLDTELDKSLGFAFDKRLGYLTQCPTNLGTGMRASVMMHLPALKESRTVARIASNLAKLGLVIRGAYGEDTDAKGDMYQISNQVSLGISEKAAIENLKSITEQLVNSELKTRENLKTVVCVTGQHRQMLDQVLKAFNVEPEYDLSIMKDKQTLFDITTNILNKIGAVLDEVKPDYAAVAFDMRKPTFRHEKYDFYKANRKGIPVWLDRKDSFFIIHFFFDSLPF